MSVRGRNGKRTTSMNIRTTTHVAWLLTLALAGSAFAEDWAQFRGPGGLGVSGDSSLPTTWSETKNLRWKIPLPGAGSSSPIVHGKHLFVTCYDGYGTASASDGKLEDLTRHLLCIDRQSGRILWKASLKASLPEDSYRGFISEHGYASSTPVTDGKGVFVFFGKSGVAAFDMQGKKLWQTNVGTESGSRRWGSSASPILYKNLVIVNASDESQSIRALDKATGKEVWKAEAAGLENSFGTPLLVDVDDGRQELVIAVPYEVWGFSPDTGKLLWFAETDLDNNVCPSLVARQGIVYGLGGRSSQSIAIRAGGKDDVTKTHVVWTSRNGSYVPSPVLHQEHLYWVNDRGQAFCANAKTGELVYQERLDLSGGNGGGGFGGRPVYASVVLAGNKLFAVTRTGGTFVLAADPQFKQIAHNKLASDESDFNASPAISNGQIFLRSNQFLYCLEVQ